MTARTPGEDLARIAAAVADGSVLDPGDPGRSAAFTMVGADPDGPVTRLVTTLTRDGRPAVRCTALRLLRELAFDRTAYWEAPAKAALARLRDQDPDVRRAAARLLVASGAADDALTLLTAPLVLTDPVVRVALADALLCGEHRRERAELLLGDGLPAVRLLACFTLLACAPPERLPVLDAIALTELVEAQRWLGKGDGPWATGERWLDALARQDREAHAYATAALLLGGAKGAVGRRIGADLAHAAMQRWRAAPAVLLPHLLAVLGPGVQRLDKRAVMAPRAGGRAGRAHAAKPQSDTAPRPVTGPAVAAVEALCASRAATRAAADQLAGLLGASDDGLAWSVACALAGVGDQRATPYLLARLSGGHLPAGIGPALHQVLADGADPAAFLPPLREVLTGEEPGGLYVAMRALAAIGPRAAPAVPELTAALRWSIAGELPYGLQFHLAVALGRIGEAAAPAAPLLAEIALGDGHTTPGAVLAHAQVTGCRDAVECYLDARFDTPRRVRDGSALFRWLYENGGLSERHARQLRRLVLERPGVMQARGAHTLWRYEGPAAAPDLLAVLPRYLDSESLGPSAMATLAAMGRHARSALPALRAVLDRRVRLPFDEPNRDAELWADEVVLEAARRTLAAIERAADDEQAPEGHGRRRPKSPVPRTTA